MTAKHITELRKSGNITEAYREAKADLDANHNDIWAQRAMAWVLYDFLKLTLDEKKWTDFDHTLAEISTVKLSEDEELFHEQMAWQIAKRIRELPVDDTNTCTAVFNLIRNMSFHKSEGYSYLFRTFHKHRANWTSYLEFCDWWNFDKFMPNDYDYFVTDGKQKVMSLAEQAYIGYANALISTHEKDRIEAFLPRLRTLMNNHPDYKYPLYYISKLLLFTEKKDEAFSSLLPFVKTKANDFWVWQILGDAAKEKEITFACYCRALTCACKPQMMVKIKEQFANMLIERNLFDAAKTEILQVIKTREANGWKLSDYLQNIKSEKWFISASDLKSNADIYKKYSDMAENAVYANSLTENIIITLINREKQIANFITTKQTCGFFRYKTITKYTPSIGDTYIAKFSEFKKDRNCQILHIQKNEDKNIWTDLLINFEGKIKIPIGKTFGIVSGKTQIFIPPQLTLNLLDGDIVNGTAVKSYDKHRQQEGWTALNIQKA